MILVEQFRNQCEVKINRRMYKSVYFLRNFSSLFQNINSIACTGSSNRAFNIRKMSIDIKELPTVEIDPSGVFKYILMKVFDKDQSSPEPLKVIVRGYKHCNYHSDIFDEVQEKLHPLDLEPFGGGRISHDPENKKIHIYGYSQGYGKADHEITAGLVKETYPDYTISISDEGY